MYTIASGIDDSGLIRLRRQRRWAIAWVSAYLPLGLMLFFVGVPVTGTPVVSAIAALTVLSVLHVRLLECPRCGQPFYSDGKWGSTNPFIPFARNCMHCDFSLADDASTYAS